MPVLKVGELEVFELPKEFRDTRKFEKVLIARRLLFKKISIMPKCLLN